jgi:hypothetical protein
LAWLRLTRQGDAARIVQIRNFVATVRENEDKEATMKNSARFILAAFAVAFAGHAFAQTSGVTREQVNQELIQTQAQGLLPAHNDYPPSARTIARNKTIYTIRHSSEQAESSNGMGAAMPANGTSAD